MSDAPDQRTDDGGRIGRCPCCSELLRPAKADVRTGVYHVAGQGPGAILFFVCPRCRTRLLGSILTGERWEDADPAQVAWYPGSHQDPKWWGL
jgi:uncharacterized C2H2 Zn-finger protein